MYSWLLFKTLFMGIERRKMTQWLRHLLTRVQIPRNPTVNMHLQSLCSYRKTGDIQESPQNSIGLLARCTHCLKQGAQRETAPVAVPLPPFLTSPQTYCTLNNFAFRSELECYNQWAEHRDAPVAFEIFIRNVAPFAFLFACDPNVINTQVGHSTVAHDLQLYQRLNHIRTEVIWNSCFCTFTFDFFFNLKMADLNIYCV